jgi:hypothetical protein
MLDSGAAGPNAIQPAKIPRRNRLRTEQLGCTTHYVMAKNGYHDYDIGRFSCYGVVFTKPASTRPLVIEKRAVWSGIIQFSFLRKEKEAKKKERPRG